jgi:hypothetical protein
MLRRFLCNDLRNGAVLSGERTAKLPMVGTDAHVPVNFFRAGFGFLS